MDYMQKMQKLKVNVTRDAMFDPSIVLDMLEEAGSKWRVIWEELPTDGIFDNLYADSGKYAAFIYQGALLERRKIEPGVYEWMPSTGNGVAEWLLDNPPFECCVAIEDLYNYAQNLLEGHSPWLLFLMMTGYQTIEEIEPLLGIGNNDAVYIGRALEAWGDYADVIDPYIRLILSYTSF